jgi:chromosome segregation ATPase
MLFQSSKQIAALQAQVKDLEAKLAAGNPEAATQITDLTARLEAANKQVTDLQAQMAQMKLDHEAAVTQLNGEHKAELEKVGADNDAVILAEVNHQLAAAGMPEKQLPKLVNTPQGTTAAEKFDALQQQIDAETDPVKRGALAEQQWEQYKAAQRGIGLN